MTVDGDIFVVNPGGDGEVVKTNRTQLHAWLRRDYLSQAGDFSVFKFGKDALTLKGAKLKRVIDLAIDATLRFAKDVGEGKVPGRLPQYVDEVAGK